MDLNYSGVTTPQINTASCSLKAQPKRSIHAAHFSYSAWFFCFSQSPSAFPSPKYIGFYGNKTRHQNGQNLVTSPSADRKCNLNKHFAISNASWGRQQAIILCTCVRMCLRGRPPVHARTPSRHAIYTHVSPPASRDRIHPIPFCFNIAENCFDSWIASLFITRS